MFPDLEDQFDLNTLIRQCRAGRYSTTNNNNNNEMNGVFNMSNYNYTKQAVRALIPNNSTENSSQLVANEDTNTDSDKRMLYDRDPGMLLLFEDVFRTIDHGKIYNQSNHAFQVFISVISVITYILISSCIHI